MSSTFDERRLRQERRRFRWSQEQLADISGVSVRTIQRCERGEPIGSASVSAIAAAFDGGIQRSAARKSTGICTSPIRRVTPLCILPAIDLRLQAYVNLGLTEVRTDHPGCVGVKAESTFMILATAEFLAGDFGEGPIASLVGQTIPYIWLQSVNRAIDILTDSATVVADVVTRHGTREALIECGGQYHILADLSAAPL